MVAYNNKKFYIDIVETKPSSAISIIETDCEVDFAPPLDYKEPEKPPKSNLLNKRPLEGPLSFPPLFIFLFYLSFYLNLFFHVCENYYF